MLECASNNTIAWDATDIDGKHNKRQYIWSTFPSIWRSYREARQAIDYHRHVTETLQSVSESYVEWTDKDPSAVLETTHMNISNTIGDQVAVNHCVVGELEKNFGKRLVE